MNETGHAKGGRTLTQTCEQSPQVRQMMEVRQLIHQERELCAKVNTLYEQLTDLRKNISSRLKRMKCPRVPWSIRFLRESVIALVCVAMVGCASKPTTERPTQRTIKALTLRLPTTTTASGMATSTNHPGIQRTNLTLAWTNPNPPSDAKYMLTEFHSATDLWQPFAFKCYVAAGVTNVTFKITNAAEFFICRFAQTNITPWLVSDWNTK